MNVETNRRIRTGVAILALAAGYFVAGKLGLRLAFVNESASAVWPPTGIAIAALILWGPRLWPAIVLGAFLVNLTTAGTAVTAAGIAAGNTLEALLAAILVRKYANGSRAFERPQDVFVFVAVAVLATIASASVGTASLALTGFASTAQVGLIWLTWWLGDLNGALILAPALVAWGSLGWRGLSVKRLPEAAGLALTVVVVGSLVFGILAFSNEQRPLAFLTLPALIWAAFRFGPRGAASAALALSAVAVWGTLQGGGPFGTDNPGDALVQLQAFMGVAALTTLVTSAAIVDRARTERALLEAEFNLRHAVEEQVADRDRFLALAAHELKTPLTSLRVATQLLARQRQEGAGLNDQQVGHALEIINDRSAHLTRLVAHLLDAALMKQGLFTVALQVDDLARIACLAVERAQPTTGVTRISYLGPKTCDAYVDAVRIRQVLDDLLDNAIKFSPTGGDIDVELSQPAPDFVRLCVRDPGVGVPLERRAHLFDADPAQGVAEGLGLGLRTSREIVERHGGRISAEFPLDGGTRIVVELAAASPSSPEARGI